MRLLALFFLACATFSSPTIPLEDIQKFLAQYIGVSHEAQTPRRRLQENVETDPAANQCLTSQVVELSERNAVLEEQVKALQDTVATLQAGGDFVTKEDLELNDSEFQSQIDSVRNDLQTLERLSHLATPHLGCRIPDVIEHKDLVKCVDDQWVIMDPNTTSGWKYVFGDLDTSDAGSCALVPNRSKLVEVAVGQSISSWNLWMAPVKERLQLEEGQTLEMAQSPDCETCTNTGIGYYATGNYFGCTYYNRNCDMPDDESGRPQGECQKCRDNYNPPTGTRGPGSGACTHLDGNIGDTYPIVHPGTGSCVHWWVRAPSLGTCGKHCMCYRIVQ